MILPSLYTKYSRCSLFKGKLWRSSLEVGFPLLKDSSMHPSFLMDAQSQFVTPYPACDACGSGIPAALRAPGVCCPSDVIRSKKEHFQRAHKQSSEMETMFQGGRDAATGRGLVSVALLHAVGKVTVLGAEMEREQMATELRKVILVCNR